MVEKTTLELIDEISEFNDLHEFMNDEQLDEALGIVVKLIMQPNVPASKAPGVIVQLQAFSFKFRAAALTYQTFNKGPAASPNAYKKNIYYSLSEALDRLVDALKYSARFGMD